MSENEEVCNDVEDMSSEEKEYFTRMIMATLKDMEHRIVGNSEPEKRGK